MKKIRNKIIIFVIMGIILAFVADMIILSSNFDYNIVNAVVTTIGMIMLCVLIFEIGRSIENKSHKKRYFTYFAIVVIITLMLFLLTRTLFYDNMWLDLLGTNIFLITLLAIIFDISRVIRPKHEQKSFALRIFFYIGIGVVFIATILIINNIIT